MAEKCRVPDCAVEFRVRPGGLAARDSGLCRPNFPINSRDGRSWGDGPSRQISEGFWHIRTISERCIRLILSTQISRGIHQAGGLIMDELLAIWAMVTVYIAIFELI